MGKRHAVYVNGVEVRPIRRAPGYERTGPIDPSSGRYDPARFPALERWKREWLADRPASGEEEQP